MDLKERLGALEETILTLTPETGQFPYILLHQASGRLGAYNANWLLMQLACDDLYQKGKIYPQQDFSKSILKRVYKNGA